MKKFIYISGIIVVNFFVVGAIFKLQHWPGAGILVTLGLGLFCLGFLPLAFIKSFRGNGKKYKSVYIAGFICAFITFMGALFKIQHWPGAGSFLIIGIPLPFLYFLPVYFYFHKKSKEKSSLNFLGVMFLMVYIAVFSSLLALNVSKNILNSFNTGEEDIAKTNDVLVLRNNMLYENIEKECSAVNKEKLAQLKTKTDLVCDQINNIKLELVKSAEGGDSPAIEGDKINARKIFFKDESAGTTQIMRGDDGVSGKALELKKIINDYQKYVNTIVQQSSESSIIIDKLLSTDDAERTVYGETMTMSWENALFPNGAFVIAVLSNLACIETNVRMAEAEALETF